MHDDTLPLNPGAGPPDPLRNDVGIPLGTDESFRTWSMYCRKSFTSNPLIISPVAPMTWVMLGGGYDSFVEA